MSAVLQDLPPEVQSHQLLTREQISRLLSVSITTVWRMTNNWTNPIPSVKIGGHRRYRLDKLLKWLDMQEEEGNHHD